MPDKDKRLKCHFHDIGIKEGAMQALIAFWKAKLEDNFWLMGPENKAMVQQTIKALTELQKLRASNQVEREAEIVRTVTQLSKEREGAKRG